ncbi:MAG: Wzz/FepE/Etk N-terminal domain-containing protein [Clostridiales bacterium]|nr:Wzz/FepE/Etk N-terminal domain-containing protein [Clostridiales bacterium]
MSNKRKNNQVVEIDLLRLARACLKRLWFIITFSLLFGSCAYLGTTYFITPMYESTVKIYVNNSDISVGNVSISTSDLSASVQLVDVYEAILDTKDTLDVVIEKSGLDYTYSEISSMLTTSSVNDTQIFQVKVTNADPEEAALIASTIGDVLPEVIAGIIESADARVVEHAIVPSQPSSPNVLRNTMMGAMLGFVLSVGIVVILELMNTTIREEKDFVDIVEIPILAYIPDSGTKPKKSSSYGYYETASVGGKTLEQQKSRRTLTFFMTTAPSATR